MSHDEWLKLHIVGIRADQKALEKKVDEKFATLEGKVDQLIVKEAHQSGKVTGATIVISAIVSIIVSVIAIIAR